MNHTLKGTPPLPLWTPITLTKSETRIRAERIREASQVYMHERGDKERRGVDEGSRVGEQAERGGWPNDTKRREEKKRKERKETREREGGTRVATRAQRAEARVDGYQRDAVARKLLSRGEKRNRSAKWISHGGNRCIWIASLSLSLSRLTDAGICTIETEPRRTVTRETELAMKVAMKRERERLCSRTSYLQSSGSSRGGGGAEVSRWRCRGKSCETGKTRLAYIST